MALLARKFLIFGYTLIIKIICVTCQCGWSVQNNMFTAGGTAQIGVTSINDCLANCVKVFPNCMGVDWDAGNVNQQYCWFSNPAAQPQFANGVNHWTYTQNGVCSTNAPGVSGPTTPACYWNLTDNAFTQGGSNQPSATTLDQCKSLCSNNQANCMNYGFDWNPDTPGAFCWLSTNAQVQTMQNVKHYSFICPIATQQPPSAVCGWNRTGDNHSLNGVLMTAYNTRTGCQDACYRDTTCFKYGFDYPSEGTGKNQCWFAQGPQTGKQEGIDHFDWICNSSTTVRISVSIFLLLLYMTLEMVI